MHLGLIPRAVASLLQDKSFSLDTGPAKSATIVANAISAWIAANTEKSKQMEEKFVSKLDACILVKRGTTVANRKRMISAWHKLRVSHEYIDLWKEVLQLAGIAHYDPIFCQFVGNEMFKELVCIRHPIAEAAVRYTPATSYKDMNALRYFAGYIPRMLRKRLLTSTHPLKDDIVLCIYDLLDDGDENYQESQDWVHCVNRGGLTLVNNATFDVFVAIEEEVKKRLDEELTDKLKKEIAQSDEVNFFWSVVCGDWEEESASVLLQMIVNQFIKIRGFSHASKLVEEFKAANKKTTQKSKGIRKQLVAQSSHEGEAEDSSTSSKSS